MLPGAAVGVTRPRIAVLPAAPDDPQAVYDVPRADVDCAVGHTACLPAAAYPGYEIDEAEVACCGDVRVVRRQPVPRPAADRRHAAFKTGRATPAF